MQKFKVIFLSFVFFFASFSFKLEANAETGIVNPYKVYTYNQMVSDINKLKRTYPDLIEVKIIGKSEYGRNLYAVSIGKGQATLFVNGSHHAREWLTTTLNMYMIDQYAQAYKRNQKIKGYNARTILNSTTIWFIPMVNPDGVTLQQQGLKAFPAKYQRSLIKMNEGSKNFKRWKANGKGVDLNRQYNAGWKAIKSPTAPSYKNYKGKAPESAAETKAVLRFVSSINLEMALSYHSSGKILFWNYKQNKTDYYRDLSYAKTIGKMTGYRLVYPGKNPSGGGFTDWFIQTKKRPAFTPEISRSVYETSPPLSEFSGAWKENQAVGLYTANESFKLYDLRMKQETDKLAGQLSKLQAKAQGLRTYYYLNIKQAKDLKIDRGFKALYDTINKETASLERQAAKLPAKHKARLAGYFKNINTYRSHSKLFIDGVTAGDKLLKTNQEYDKIFAAGKFDAVTFSKHAALLKETGAVEKTVNKMYGKNVISLAKNKYIIPAKNTAENTKLELDRYTLTREIQAQVAKGEIDTAKSNLAKLEALELKSKRLKETYPAKYKLYPLAEKRLTELKAGILEALPAEQAQ
ncbi:M14 family zinc carboxypeptidase [Mesobacillus jeotgali]|uniref:M14 family zinc carboxypeptidase n=1 Tax=Mesobacillus jeotgali TaxID=129985 RepID=A0ABY9VFH1_9BACI|nr:M14 family zinc carboxypeptidase [Mesobacillus jeotgali]WNF22677.1 M14 family zinc carboxypeptidase [Mesobacillus jeotgali]